MLESVLSHLKAAQWTSKVTYQIILLVHGNKDFFPFLTGGAKENEILAGMSVNGHTKNWFPLNPGDRGTYY